MRKHRINSVMNLKKPEQEYLGYSIVAFDEAGFRLVPVYRRAWFFKGEKPKGVFFWSNKKLKFFEL